MNCIFKYRNNNVIENDFVYFLNGIVKAKQNKKEEKQIFLIRLK